MKKDDKTTKKLIIVIAVFSPLIFALIVFSIPFINLISELEIQSFKAWVTSLDVWGWLLVLLIQIVQIVIAFIPGEPVEVLSGVLYGGGGGLFLCLFGCVIASSCVFMLSKKFGKPLLTKIFKKNKLDEFAFMQDSMRLQTIVLILFLIPGTPKDMLTYVVGISSMKITQFLVISTLARIPSIISSTFIGSTIQQGEWKIAVLIFALTAVLGILGVKYQGNIISFCKRIGRIIKGREHKRGNS